MMNHQMKLATIPPEQFSDYRYNVIFNAYKWDPQVEDRSTVSRQVILMERSTAHQLEQWAEQLSAETMAMEEALVHRPELVKELRLPKELTRHLPRLVGYDRQRHVRLMRFDFHPTQDGWAISEVNSDVPGGFAEASVLPQIAAGFFDGWHPRGHIGDSLLHAFEQKRTQDAPVAFVHATAYADDRQVMQFLSDHLNRHQIPTLFAAPDHIRWSGGQATSLVEGHKGPVGGIVRFYPLEWLPNLPQGSDWSGYFGAETPSCNHPIAILTQSKRLPLVWDRLGVETTAWKKLLPETRDPKEVKTESDWIFKPALGRVGEGISIRGTMPEKEYKKIHQSARRHPENWVAQRMFPSQPLIGEDGQEYHTCIGVFTVDGVHAGFYGRVSPYPRIDDKAEDIPILVKKEGTGA